MAKPKGAPIVILGMHRSGTSLVASMLHRIGIRMGEDFLAADSHNLDGYFEDTNFLWINKGILENCGGIWYDPPRIEEIREGGKKFHTALDKVIKERRKMAGANPWGWKDPRNCLTCWTFGTKVPDAKYIIIVRRLSDIKRSLNEAHGHAANWSKVIDAYYSSIDRFAQICANAMMTISFEELVYEKYAEEATKKILHFVDKPESTLRKAMSVIRLR